MNVLKVLDLFSGIGAFSLGLERAGMQTVAFCEIDPFCRKVLKKHWPEVPCYEDVTALTAARLRADGVAPDVVCGGFPCQDISVAGKGAGIGGGRSGLWSEYARIVGEFRPRYVIVENVAALLGRGIERVLGDLAALGYDAEWHCIPAAAVGAPHLRDRVWIVAYAGGDVLRNEQQRMSGGRTRRVRDEGQAIAGDDGPQGTLADADRGGQPRPRRRVSKNGDASRGPDVGDGRSDVANSDGGGRREQGHVGEALGNSGAGQSGDGGEALAISERVGRQWAPHPGASCRDEGAGQDAEGRRKAGDDAAARRGVRIAGRPRLEIGPGTLRQWAHAATTGAGRWAAEPDVGRVVDGTASRVDRRKRLIAIGNALVPQIPELIGRAILEFENARLR